MPKQQRGGNRGGGSPAGHSNFPIKAPAEVIVDTVIELSAGMPPGEAALKHSLAVSEVRKIQSLVGLAPQEYFDAIGSRMEPVLDQLNQAMEKKMKDVLAGRDEASVKDLAIAVDIYRKNLSEIRGTARPANVHQTNIQINNLSRDEALKLLKGNNS